MENIRNKAHKLLRQSEGLFKTDMVYLAHGGFWLLFGQGAAMVASLILAIAFANLIDPELYGNYKYVLSVAGIIGAFSLSGLGTAILRATSRKHDGTLKYAFKLSLTWSFGMVFIAIIGGTYYLMNGNQFLGFSFFIIGATAPILYSGNLYQPFLLGKKRFKQASLYSIVQNILPTLSVLTAILLGAPLLLMVGVYFLSNSITLFIIYKKTLNLAENNKVDPATNHIGKHLSIMGIVSAISGRLDSILIFQLLGGTELAIFSLATAMPDMIRGSLKHLTSLAMPKFANKSKEEMKNAVWSRVKIVALITGLIALVYILATPYLFEIFFPKYISAIRYSQVYGVSIMTSLVLASAYFDSQVAVRERYILNVVINGIGITTMIIGIYLFGLWGAIIARLVTRLVNVGLTAALISRH